MTQEEKQLLLQDLCARLPYGIKFPYHIEEDSNHRECNCIATIYSISEDIIEFTYNDGNIERDWTCAIFEVKPYLRPMSSMTDEEKEELKQISNDYLDEWENTKTSLERWKLDAKVSYKRAVFYNSHHIDWNDLIPKGLAIAVTEEMYKTE